MFYDAPGSTAGPRINALRILPQLANRGWDVHAIIGYYASCPAADSLIAGGVTPHPIEWPFFCEDQVAEVQRRLLAIDPDVFVPNISASGCYVARFLREAGRPTIAGHLSDDIFNWAMAERFCRLGDDYAVSALFCMGRSLGDIVRGWSPARTQVVDISPGVPLSETTAKLDGPLRMVYAGRLEDEQKRICDLVAALIRVMRKFPDAESLIIGQGSKDGEIRSLVREAGQESRFHFTGYVAPDHVQSEMQWGNTLVLLSDYEGIPAAVMDGMSAGLVPVCLSIPGGLQEIVIDGKTGLLVRNRTDDFAAAIERLALDIPLRQRLSAAARAHIEKSYSLPATVDAWEKLMFELIRNSTRRHIQFPSGTWLPAKVPAFADQDVRRDFAGRVYHARRVARLHLERWQATMRHATCPKSERVRLNLK